MSCELLSGLLSCPRILLHLAAVGVVFLYFSPRYQVSAIPLPALNSTSGLNFLGAQAYFHTCTPNCHQSLIKVAPQ